MASPTVKLNSGHDMPLVGFGLWKVDNAVCADTVYQAIKAGYRLLDGACGTYSCSHTPDTIFVYTRDLCPYQHASVSMPCHAIQRRQRQTEVGRRGASADDAA